MTDVVIRGYSPTDREDCRRLWRELTEWHRQIYQDPSIGGPHPEDYFDGHLAEVGADRLWVAVVDSQVVGLVGLMVDEEEAEVEPVIVSQPYRREGIGRRLMETIVSEARRLGMKHLSVRPVARNVEAITFIHELGFTNMGHIEFFMDFTGRQWRKGLELFGLCFNF